MPLIAMPIFTPIFPATTSCLDFSRRRGTVGSKNTCGIAVFTIIYRSMASLKLSAYFKFITGPKISVVAASVSIGAFSIIVGKM